MTNGIATKQLIQPNFQKKVGFIQDNTQNYFVGLNLNEIIVGV